MALLQHVTSLYDERPFTVPSYIGPTVIMICTPKPTVRAAHATLQSLIESEFAESSLEFFMNGKKIILDNPNPDWTLLDFIRSQHGTKGTKLGCGEGGCGACTVVLQTLDHHHSGNLNHIAVNACLYPLAGVIGKHLITIEGLGNAAQPHPIQERIAKLHGSQCGFCTPGIVMSVYAMIRNAWDPVSKVFRLSASTIELEGHLDGNLCRCTGYKPILAAIKTFITEDLRSQIVEQNHEDESSPTQNEELYNAYSDERAAWSYGKPQLSCGRPGGCCRDAPPVLSDNSSDEHTDSKSPDEIGSQSSSASPDFNPSSKCSKEAAASGASFGLPVKLRDRHPSPGKEGEGTKTASDLTLPPPKSSNGGLQIDLMPYEPAMELIFPPALRTFEHRPICYGVPNKIWLRPTNIEQLLSIKTLDPSAKLVSGSSEVHVEVRFKNSSFKVMVYIGDVAELQRTHVPENDDEITAMDELVVGANTSLTEVEAICARLAPKLGRRGTVLEACRKQLRYFAGRQIRNTASLAGNLATASPISDMNPVLLAAGATILARSKSTDSIALPLETFFLSYRKTSLPPDAVITGIRIPIPAAHAEVVMKTYKQAKRKEDDIAIVTAAFKVYLDASGCVNDIALAFGGMAPTTLLAKTTGKALSRQKWRNFATLDAGLKALREEFSLAFDVPGGMASYRVTLALSFFFRFWHEVVNDFGLGLVDEELIQEIQRGLSSGSRDDFNPHEQSIVGKQIPHLSALKQTTGEAEYLGDMPKQDRELHGAFVFSQRAHAKLVEVDWSSAIGPGLAVGYVDKNDLPPELNSWGSIRRDEPFFADGVVHSHGQVIGLVYAETAIQAAKAAKLVKIVYEDLPAILTIDEAVAANSFYPHGRELRKGAANTGSMDGVFSSCDRVFEGVVRMGGQEHFYLETHAAMVIPHPEDNAMEVWSSTQNTMETQEFVSHVTGVPSHKINARVKRAGGAFGGKESRSVPIACVLAVAAKKEKRPIRCMLNRDEDMISTGQRHPFQARWKVGAMSDGSLVALDIDLYNAAGWTYDMSAAVMDRCATHVENCYNIPNVHIRGHVCRTNTHSNTAFRGFGGPQAMFIAETYMTAVAEGLDIPIDELRLKNLYKAKQLTPFLQSIDEDWHIPLLLSSLKAECDFERRKIAVATFNSRNKWKKRGISLLPSKFGISFATAIHLNQASAAVKIYADGSILLHHGGTEMGQGLYTKMAQIAAQELNVPLDAVYTDNTSSYYTANVAPTAASAGSDLNGMAIKNACDQLNERLKPYREKFGPEASMKTIAHAAYLDRVDLSASGFWKMPTVGFRWGNYDPETQKPMYYYFTQGVACSEVELDLLTGDHTVIRTDIKMDIGQSINPAIDYGQIEGAFVQGQGLFTMEESLWTRDGQLFTKGPGTYKIPGFSDIPQEFNVSFLQGVSWSHLRTIQSSKGVGEPPLFLGASVVFALREALVSARKQNGVTEPLTLDSPATAERLRLAVGDELLKMGTVVPKEGEKSFFVTVA
ncbi:hypothetical protein H2200_008490 [Cladophialophora chaetospira]|uniref:Xanthine dehydrogenase n=1 Tax=Cladophialophora chaetospira TaxID=386627 RepID=A0AA38X5X9_9EURO|nr:hypothetical protein H2200_008490 [Cladophialophora chaetospira]